jgi:hypothetical protein
MLLRQVGLVSRIRVGWAALRGMRACRARMAAALAKSCTQPRSGRGGRAPPPNAAAAAGSRWPMPRCAAAAAAAARRRGCRAGSMRLWGIPAPPWSSQATRPAPEPARARPAPERVAPAGRRRRTASGSRSSIRAWRGTWRRRWACRPAAWSPASRPARPRRPQHGTPLASRRRGGGSLPPTHTSRPLSCSTSTPGRGRGLDPPAPRIKQGTRRRGVTCRRCAETRTRGTR